MKKCMVTTVADPGSGPAAVRRRRAERVPAAMSEPQSRELDLAHGISREETVRLLDEALGETFPARDPVAITPRKHDAR